MKKSRKIAQKFDENAKLYHFPHLTSEIWLQIQNFQEILVQGTPSLHNIYFQVAWIGYAEDLYKIAQKLTIFSYPSTLHLSWPAHVFKIWPNMVLSGSYG